MLKRGFREPGLKMGSFWPKKGRVGISVAGEEEYYRLRIETSKERGRNRCHWKV